MARKLTKYTRDVVEICPVAEKPCYDKKGAATAKNKRYQQDRIELRIYLCNGHWHLTSLRASKKKIYD